MRRIAIIDDGAGIDDPKANAHLAAAAPEWLDSLIRIEEYEPDDCWDESGLWAVEEMKTIARAALAKATNDTKEGGEA